MGAHTGDRAMTESVHTINESCVIVMSGLPGTLKSFISLRVARRLGCAYLPTSSFGSVARYSDASELAQLRHLRYELLGSVMPGLARSGAVVLVDGGFLRSEDRRRILEAGDWRARIIVHCFATEASRMKRLRVRSLDRTDPEGSSASAILKSAPILESDVSNASVFLDDGANAIISIDTDSAQVSSIGSAPSPQSKDLLRSLIEAVSTAVTEHGRSPIPASLDAEIARHFDDLSEMYDDSTSWRSEPTLLSHMFVHAKIREGYRARVLDVGTGTGLASKYYSESGHIVVGLDISPVILTRAAARLTVAVQGSALALPFPDQHFDLVLCRQNLHYTDARIALSEIYRCLRKGGQLVVSSIVAPNKDAQPFWTEFKSTTQPLRLEVFTKEILHAYLDQSGFTLDDTLIYVVDRTERLNALEARSIQPSGGWDHYWDMCCRVAAHVSTDSEMRVVIKDSERFLSYRQHWVTIWANRN